MAISAGPRPDYNIGKVTLTAGSDVFTTVGASLDIIAVQAGDTILTPSGLFLVIAEITGPESGKLVWPCPAGAAGVDLPLRIRFQPEGSRLMATAAAILARFSSGNVTSLADLQSQANTMPFFSGIGQMSLTEFPAFARTLLRATSGSAAYGALGEVPDTSLPLRLGSSGRRIPGADWNNATDNGWWMEANAANAPLGSNSWYLGIVERHNSVYITQTVHAFTTATASKPQMYRRHLRGGAWGDWYPLAAENGTNSNGSFVRLADGSQLCWHTLLGTGYDLGSSSFRTWVFPSQFSAVPIPSITMSRPANDTVVVNARVGATLNTVGFNMAHSGGNTLNVVFQIAAYGRWY